MVDRATIKLLVVRALASASGRDLEPNSPGLENQRLAQDLGMLEDARRSLKVPFNKITKKYGGDMVLFGECQALTKVKDTIDLVHARANGN